MTTHTNYCSATAIQHLSAASSASSLSVASSPSIPGSLPSSIALFHAKRYSLLHLSPPGVVLRIWLSSLFRLWWGCLASYQFCPYWNCPGHHPRPQWQPSVQGLCSVSSKMPGSHAWACSSLSSWMSIDLVWLCFCHFVFCYFTMTANSVWVEY